MLSGIQPRHAWSGVEPALSRWLTCSDTASLRPPTFTPNWTKIGFIEWHFHGREVRHDRRLFRKTSGALPRIAASARFRNAGRAVASRLPDLSPRAHTGRGLIAQAAVEWASSRGGSKYQAGRLSMARCFLAHLRAHLPGIEVPAPGMIPSGVRPTP